MIRACLFDLDGVLCDTARYHFLAWQEIANELGIDFNGQDNEQLKGVSRVESLNLILKMGHKTLSKPDIQKYLDLKNERYLKLIKHMTPNELFQGVRPFIESIREADIKTGLGSASKNAPIILDKLEINDLFDVVIDGNHVKNSKPAPDVFMLGAKALHIAPAQCVVFEDAPAGIEAAKAAGMACVGVGSREALPEADTWISDFKTLDLTQLKKAITL